VTFHAGGESSTRPIKDKSGVDHLIAPRRYVLDTILAEAAARAGASVRTGVTVTGVDRDGAGRATGVGGLDRGGTPIEVGARIVIGADGLGSRVARAVRADIVEDRGADGATLYAYYSGPEWPGIEFFTADGLFAGIFPTNDEQACIWVCAPSAATRAARRSKRSAEEVFEAQLRQGAPELARRLRAARRTSPVRGMLRAPNQLRRAHGPGWALVGDAGYHRDAASGHGLSDAFRDAELLALALDPALRGDEDEATALAGYERRRDEALREIFEITCALVRYPPVPDFVALTRQLGGAIDTEAAALAALPIPGEPELVPA
jgi:flavin-dependent dehydrogenase